MSVYLFVCVALLCFVFLLGCVFVVYFVVCLFVCVVLSCVVLFCFVSLSVCLFVRLVYLLDCLFGLVWFGLVWFGLFVRVCVCGVFVCLFV